MGNDPLNKEECLTGAMNLDNRGYILYVDSLEDFLEQARKKGKEAKERFSRMSEKNSKNRKIEY